MRRGNIYSEIDAVNETKTIRTCLSSRLKVLREQITRD